MNSEILLQLISSLGNSPQEIRNTLAERKITGIRSSPWCCPVASFLRKQIPNCTDVSVRPSVATVYTEAGTTDCSVPKPVKYFVENFDAGNYPELEHSWVEEPIKP